MPALERHGFAGTFYVNPDTDYDYGGYVTTTSSSSSGSSNAAPAATDPEAPPLSKWERQVPGWVAAAARGHEVGNHTTDHPCSCNFGFSDPCLEEMALADIAGEYSLQPSWAHFLNDPF